MQRREFKRRRRRAHQRESTRAHARSLLQVGAIGDASAIVLATNNPRRIQA